MMNPGGPEDPWYFTADQLKKQPSMEDGVSYDVSAMLLITRIKNICYNATQSLCVVKTLIKKSMCR